MCYLAQERGRADLNLRNNDVMAKLIKGHYCAFVSLINIPSLSAKPDILLDILSCSKT